MKERRDDNDMPPYPHYEMEEGDTVIVPLPNGARVELGLTNILILTTYDDASCETVVIPRSGNQIIVSTVREVIEEEA
jgi:hypothetical protein